MPEQVSTAAGEPSVIGHYAVVRRLGEGGQGVVYLARSAQGQACAVKVLRLGWLSDPTARQRLVREVAAARQVPTFCTAAVLDADLAGDRPFVVTEYVPGPTLAEQVRGSGALRGSELTRLAIGTATALTAIHLAGVVHRDLKPANVILGPQGPRVIDFGIARDASDGLTMPGQVIGTPTYMAPEQVRAGQVGAAADVFAWACTMAFAATGRPAFGTGPAEAVVYRVLTAHPDLAGVEPGLTDLLLRCLAKDPAHRPTAQQVLHTLLRPAPATLTGPYPTVLLTLGAVATAPAVRPTGVAPWHPDPQPRATPPRPKHGTVLPVALVVFGLICLLLLVGWAKFALSPTPAEAHGSSGQALAIPRDYAGTWTGHLADQDGPTTDMELTLPAGATSGTVDYPRAGCSGRVQVSGVGDQGSYLQLDETITSGSPADCPAGRIRLTQDTSGLSDGSRLTLTWQIPGDPTSLETGTLHN